MKCVMNVQGLRQSVDNACLVHAMLVSTEMVKEMALLKATARMVYSALQVAAV